jgi:ferredoxin
MAPDLAMGAVGDDDDVLRRGAGRCPTRAIGLVAETEARLANMKK